MPSPATREGMQIPDTLAAELARRQADAHPELALHGRAVAQYAGLIARAVGLSPARTEQITLAGELHDIGKLVIPRSVLDKPGPLDENEWAHIHAHPVTGARMLGTAGLEEIGKWVLDHHERPDGRGYPSGIRAISLEARILAVADAYHAMISDRPYKAAMSPIDATEELRLAAGSQFDPSVVRAFLTKLENPRDASNL
jgi:two-component system cell cycle response regulator